MTRSLSKEGYIKGYRDIPSLAALRHRASFTKGSGGVGETIPERSVETSPGGGSSPTTVFLDDDTKNVNGNAREEKPRDEGGIIFTPVSASSTSTESGKGKEHPLQHAWLVCVHALPRGEADDSGF
jgi:translation initiation factor 4E